MKMPSGKCESPAVIVAIAEVRAVSKGTSQLGQVVYVVGLAGGGSLEPKKGPKWGGGGEKQRTKHNL